MVVIEKMQLRKTTTFQLTFSNGADEKSCVFEINPTSTLGGKISITTGLNFCIDSLHCIFNLKGINLFTHLAYVVYKHIQRHVEKRSTYAHFTRLKVEYRPIIQMIIVIHFADIHTSKTG